MFVRELGGGDADKGFKRVSLQFDGQIHTCTGCSDPGLGSSDVCASCAEDRRRAVRAADAGVHSGGDPAARHEDLRNCHRKNTHMHTHPVHVSLSVKVFSVCVFAERGHTDGHCYRDVFRLLARRLSLYLLPGIPGQRSDHHAADAVPAGKSWNYTHTHTQNRVVCFCCSQM